MEHFDDFRRRKSRQNDDFRGRFYVVAEFFSLGAENGYCLTIFGAENRAKMTILWANFMRWLILFFSSHKIDDFNRRRKNNMNIIENSLLETKLGMIYII